MYTNCSAPSAADDAQHHTLYVGFINSSAMHILLPHLACGVYTYT